MVSVAVEAAEYVAGLGAALAEEDGEVDDTAVKHLSLDFASGQRILSRVHILCQVRHARRARRGRIARCRRSPTRALRPGRRRLRARAQGFREQAKLAMDGVKAKEYQIAKQEVMKAQERIDNFRTETGSVGREGESGSNTVSLRIL